MSFSSTLSEILGDETIRRREFPVVARKKYLAHAAVCPLPAFVVSALRDYLNHVECGGQFEFLHAKAEAGARQLAGDLLGASADEIAFVPSTSAGLGMVASGLDWNPGDSVVIAKGDFPANVYPWLALERKGVVVRQIETEHGLITPETLAPYLDGTTRLVSLSSVHFATGARLDCDALGQLLRSRGILFCVDAIQSFGAMPTSARHADFLVADAHKWLLGPQGMGVLFIRRENFARLFPPLVGWKSVSGHKDFGNQQLIFADSARRYEPGSLNPLGIVGLHAALTMLSEVGIDQISQHLLALRQQLVPALEAKGYEVVAPKGVPQERLSGIVSFRRDDVDMPALCKSLDEKDFVLSLREDPLGRPCVRVSPHFYNTSAEIDQLLDLL